MDALTILLPIRDGAAFLPAQLASLAAQRLLPAGLIASDDGSRDASRALVAGFAADATFPVDLRPGPCRGWGANTLALLAAAPPGRGVALCDQDDVWHPARLARAAVGLTTAAAGHPALYTARRWICDAGLHPRRISPRIRRPGFGNALVQNIAPANTIALNPAALALAQRAGLDCAAPPPFPDWWLYQLITGAGGTVICDPEPMLYHRQHPGNLFGPRRGLRAQLTRLRQLSDGRYRGWRLAQAQRLMASAHRLTPAARALLAAMLAGEHPSALSRQSRPEALLLRLALSLGRA